MKLSNEIIEHKVHWTRIGLCKSLLLIQIESFSRFVRVVKRSPLCSNISQEPIYTFIFRRCIFQKTRNAWKSQSKAVDYQSKTFPYYIDFTLVTYWFKLEVQYVKITQFVSVHDFCALALERMMQKVHLPFNPLNLEMLGFHS